MNDLFATITHYGPIAAMNEIEEKAKLALSAANAGLKYDNGKPDLSIVPLALETACARAFEFGANKYGRNNYRHGLKYTRLIAAALRHIKAWNEVEDLDLESGLSHLDHAIACLAMLAVSENSIENSEKYDDRDLHYQDNKASKDRGAERLASRYAPRRPGHGGFGHRDDGTDSER